MNRQGPGHRPMGLSFPQASPALPAGRGIPNGKPGVGGWSGAPPPGVPTPGGGRGLTFSQSVGGPSQPSTPLDMNEFPALGGQPQSNPAQVWSRINTQSPRPTQQQQSQQQQQHDGAFGGGTVQKDLFPSMEDYRTGGASGGPVEDFPALPRTQTGLGDMGALSARGMTSRLLPQLDGILGQPQGVLPLGEVEKKNILKPGTLNGAPGLTGAPGIPLGVQQQLQPQQQPSRPSPAPGLVHPSQQQQPPQQPPLQPQQTLQKPGAVMNGDIPSSSPSPYSPQSTRVTENERFSLSGLFSAMRSDTGEGSSLAKGQDLMMLGLDINSPDGALWPSFSSPFAELESTAVEPDFQLPQCYTVINTQPVHSKIGSFSDETLFYIFYTMPRDIMQEIVVAELAARNWRYHMLHRLWMTKDPTAQVEQFSETAEKGVYVFFDPMTWERMKKEIVLEYSHLDPRTTGTYLGLQSGVGPLAGLSA